MSTTKFDDYRGQVTAIRVRVAPIDVGFDLRTEGCAVELTPDTTIASYADRRGERWVVEGDVHEIARVLRSHGYRTILAGGR